jgi:ppGpp synthetase/RelA/SpoT-type nucleotidyltranferase
MIVPPKIRARYDYTLPYVKILSDNVRQVLLSFCSANNFAFTDRIKTVDSLSEKIESGRVERWDEIEDLYAATIIIPSQKTEQTVIRFLETTFTKVKIKKKGSTLKSPEVFRFDSTRFIGKLEQSGEKTIISDIQFECQIKTAFEHAWAVATHSLTYKTNDIDWKLLRISAQLKSSVEQLDMLVNGATLLNPYVIEHKWPEISIKKYIITRANEFLKNENVPAEFRPKDVSRFSDNIFNIIKKGISNDETRFYKSIDRIFFESNKYANQLGYSNFPRSISMFQFVLGVICNLGFDIPKHHYSVLVTDELILNFPKTKEIENRFVLE